MIINSIENGIVIDHIKAGNGSRILDFLNIDTRKHTVAFLMNATSKANGHKDVIKIDAVNDVDLNVLGLIDPNCTVNIIKNGKIVEKIRPEMPKVVKNVIKCKNPRCVTSVESGAPQIFHLINEATGEYRCEYCDEIISMEEDDIHEILHP
ncbi:MAG: aspartate carbamoyltransferase regulatory subunit [Oscillospiraceae bacterium]